MRRLPIALAVCLSFFVPARAYAWFGLLDYLSGPGRFKGALYDVRLLCFGEPFELHTRIEQAVAEALRTSLEYSSAPPADRSRTARAALDAWNAVNTAIVDANKPDGGFRVLPKEPDEGPVPIQNLVKVLEPLAAVPAPGQPVARETDLARAAVLLPGLFVKATEAALTDAQLLRTANVTRSSVGMLLSLCSPEETRRFSVDFGVDFWKADSNPTWANDYTIRLITFVPGVSLRPITDARYDFFDLAMAGGLYRFSSRGFDTFTGLILQPRVDFHGPTAWVNRGGVRQALALFTGRFGYTNFPGGIPASAFGNPDPSRTVSGHEWTPTASIFFNLTPFLRHKAVVPKLSTP